VFVFQSSGKLGFNKVIPIHNDYSVGSWVDLRERQVMDVVFWHKKENKVYIHSGAVVASGIEGDTSSNYAIPSLETPGQAVPMVLDILPGSKIQEKLALNIHPIIRFSDLDLDGYMDLVINTIDSDGSSNVHIFQNTPCNITSDVTCRTFVSEYPAKSIGVTKGRNAFQTSVFDFGERG